MRKQLIIVVYYILVAIAVAAVWYICTKPLLAVSDNVLLTDVAVSGALLAGILYLFRKIVRFDHFSTLPIRQQLINYVALATLFVLCWVGLEYYVLYLSFGEDDRLQFQALLPIKVVVALLVYVVIVLTHSGAKMAEDESMTEEMDNEDITETKVTEKVEEAERIVVKDGQKIEVIPTAEIIYLQAEGDYVMIYTAKGRFLKEQTMKSFESILPVATFVRVHRSNIVNIEYIAQIEQYNKQSQLLKLKNGTQIKVSQSGYKALKAALNL